MPLVDREARVAGRINLFDAIIGLFLIGLLPIAYGSLLLFRPAHPHVRTVTVAAVNQEDRRIANGLEIRLKLKVKGDHLTPMLHANIDATPAIGFTFEDPTSADVIVGDVPMGTHDLVLLDGVQEVARVPGAVVILPTPGAAVRVVGTLIQLDEATAKGLHAGQRFEVSGQVAAELVQLGDVQPDRQRIATSAGAHIEAAVEGAWQRPVAMRVHCQPDPDATVCRIGSTTFGDPSSSVLNVPGSTPPLRMLVGAVLPDTVPQPAAARVRVMGQRDLVDVARQGDRDIRGGALDDRAASVTAVRKDPGSDAFELVLHLGLDRASDGWRYRAQSIEPGTPFTFVSDRYSLTGSVVSVVIDGR
jgi:hypothetical protein